jgi:Pal1 cell morphology protein
MDGPGNHFYFKDKNPFRNRIDSLSLEHRRSNSAPGSAIEHSRNEFRESLKQQQDIQRRKSHRHHNHRRNRVNPDVIDQLDNVNFMQYHHEGPYDAVYPERNVCSKRSPLEAVKDTNEETLRATPMHKIIDSVSLHRPLDGVAFYPPGTTDDEGQTYDYTEGDNMTVEREGRFPRVPGEVIHILSKLLLKTAY